MARSLKFLGVAMALLGAGCAPGNPGISIRGMIAGTPGSSGQGCTYDPSATTLQISHRLDLRPGFGVNGPRYLAILAVENNILNRATTQFPVQADVNDVHMESFHVLLLTAAGTSVAEYDVPAQGFIPSGTGTEPGVGIATVAVVPPNVANVLLNQSAESIFAHIQARGTTTGGVEVTSPEHVMAIDLCYGCMNGACNPDNSFRGCIEGQDGDCTVGEPAEFCRITGTCASALEFDCSGFGYCVNPDARRL